ncbi:MAG TPA: hypothetical protein VFM45_02105 [Anaeromyxobacteraceae bacterium]|nr:hypothetical protein [Anaeromyxobacteraceae bacterium]
MSRRSRVLAVALLASAAACSKGTPAPGLVVTPASASVVAGGVLAFAASAPGEPSPSVTWSVAEGDAGGGVDGSGRYFSPPFPGTYHVVAARRSEPAQRASAAVTVLPATCALPSPQPSALPGPQVIALGVHAVGEAVTFPVPAGTGSVTIVQQGVEQAAARWVTWQGTPYLDTVVPLTVSVDGTVYYDDLVPPPDDPAAWGGPDGIGAIFVGVDSPWTGTLGVPNTTNMLDHVAAHGGVPSGTWSVVVNDVAEECRRAGPPGCVVGDGVTAYPPGRYDVTALLKPGPVGATGTLDLVFRVVTSALDATSAAADPSVARMRETLATYLARMGVALGAVTFADVPPEVKARFAAGVNADDTGPCGDLASLLRLAGPGAAMNLFLVDSYYSADPGTVVGLDGTIPGPATVGGTVASGASAAVEDLWAGAATSCGTVPDPRGCGADQVAYVVAHEMGHFLGLYHDSEWTGTLFDPLRDTPTCPCRACAPASLASTCHAGAVGPTTYAMTTTDCTRRLTDPSSPCGGGENLMFWALGARSEGTVTPEQAAIVRASPLVR